MPEKERKLSPEIVEILRGMGQVGLVIMLFWASNGSSQDRTIEEIDLTDMGNGEIAFSSNQFGDNAILSLRPGESVPSVIFDSALDDIKVEKTSEGLFILSCGDKSCVIYGPNIGEEPGNNRVSDTDVVPGADTPIDYFSWFDGRNINPMRAGLFTVQEGKLYFSAQVGEGEAMIQTHLELFLNEQTGMWELREPRFDIPADAIDIVVGHDKLLAYQTEEGVQFVGHGGKFIKGASGLIVLPGPTGPFALATCADGKCYNQFGEEESLPSDYTVEHVVAIGLQKLAIELRLGDGTTHVYISDGTTLTPIKYDPQG